MGIPEAQLETWSRQGSVTQSKNTYRTIKNALENTRATYADRSFTVFLQGSYGNDTNVFAESDVDIVIRYDGAFYHDLTALPAEQQTAFNQSFPTPGTYPYASFKNDVEAALRAAFGNSVKPPGNKAIKVEAGGSRRSADVLAAFEYRRYYEFNSTDDQNYDLGIAFFTSDGARVENYPKQHSDNCTAKHQAANNNFKPLVRIFKNMRNRLVDDGLIGEGVAPSYYIEGLLYNVPNGRFAGNYETIVFNILSWLYETADRTGFLCASEQHYLLRDGHPVCWPVANGEQFINAVIGLWNNW